MLCQINVTESILNTIDWPLAFDILKSISIIVASTVAIYGVNSWRRETKWKRKYELAEEVLALFYQAKDVISIMRSPFGHSEEGKTRKRAGNESEEITEALDRAYTTIERYENNKEPFAKLRALKYRSISVFGNEIEKPFNDLFKLCNRIMQAALILGKSFLEQ